MSRTKESRPPIAGLVRTSLQLPEALHNQMKLLRQIRHEREGIDPKLCRIFLEAVEYYLNARPQRLLLEEYQQTAEPELEAAGVHADPL